MGTTEVTEFMGNTTYDYATTFVARQLSEDTLRLQRIANGFWRYGSIILLAIGTIGNLLSFIVMMTKQLRGSVTSVYLAVLAVADTMVLYTGLLRQWVRVIFNYDVRLVSNVGCRLHVFLVYFTVWFAIWLLVLVSIERFVNVFFPHSAKRLFTRSRAILSIVGLFLCDVIIHVFFFWVLEIRKTGTVEICDFYDHGRYLGIQVRKVWPPINIVVAFWLPSLLVLLFNVSILLKLRCPRRTSTVAPLGNAGVVSSQPKVSSMTLTLLGVAFAFLLAVTPMALYLALEYKWPDPEEYFQAQLSLWWAIANWLMYCNSSMNFFLYVLAGPRFRRRLCEMLFRKSCSCIKLVGTQEGSAVSHQGGTSTSARRQSTIGNTSQTNQRTAISIVEGTSVANQPKLNANQLHPNRCLKSRHSKPKIGVSNHKQEKSQNVQNNNGYNNLNGHTKQLQVSSEPHSCSDSHHCESET